MKTVKGLGFRVLGFRGLGFRVLWEKLRHEGILFVLISTQNQEYRGYYA